MPLGFNISEVKKENINEKVKESSLFFKSCIYAVDSAFEIVFSFLGDYIKNIKNDDERKEFESSSFFIKIKEISLSVLSTTKEPTNKKKEPINKERIVIIPDPSKIFEIKKKALKTISKNFFNSVYSQTGSPSITDIQDESNKFAGGLFERYGPKNLHFQHIDYPKEIEKAKENKKEAKLLFGKDIEERFLVFALSSQDKNFDKIKKELFETIKNKDFSFILKAIYFSIYNILQDYSSKYQGKTVDFKFLKEEYKDKNIPLDLEKTIQKKIKEKNLIIQAKKIMQKKEEMGVSLKKGKEKIELNIPKIEEISSFGKLPLTKNVFKMYFNDILPGSIDFYSDIFFSTIYLAIYKKVQKEKKLRCLNSKKDYFIEKINLEIKNLGDNLKEAEFFLKNYRDKSKPEEENKNQELSTKYTKELDNLKKITNEMNLIFESFSSVGYLRFIKDNIRKINLLLSAFFKDVRASDNKTAKDVRKLKTKDFEENFNLFKNKLLDFFKVEEIDKLNESFLDSRKKFIGFIKNNEEIDSAYVKTLEGIIQKIYTFENNFIEEGLTKIKQHLEDNKIFLGIFLKEESTLSWWTGNSRESLDFEAFFKEISEKASNLNIDDLKEKINSRNTRLELVLKSYKEYEKSFEKLKGIDAEIARYIEFIEKYTEELERLKEKNKETIKFSQKEQFSSYFEVTGNVDIIREGFIKRIIYTLLKNFKREGIINTSRDEDVYYYIKKEVKSYVDTLFSIENMNTTFSDIRNKIISDEFIKEFKDILDKMEIKENELPNFNNLNEDELQSFFELIFKKATDKSQEKLINEKSQRDSNLFSEFVKAPSFEILKASMKKKKEYFYSPENLPKYVIEELREIFIFTNEIRGWNFKEDAEEEGLIDVKPEKEPQIEKEMNMLREKFEYEDDEEYLIFIKKVFSKIIEKTEFSQEDTDNINRWMPLIPIVIEQIKINKDYYPIFSKQGSLYGSSAVIAEVSKTKVITLLKINRKKIKDIKQKLKKDLSEVILNWYLDDIKLKIIRLEYTNLGDSSEYKPFRDRYRKKNKIDLEKISDEIPKYIGEFFQEKLKNLVLIPINEIEYKMKVELFIKSKIIEKRKPIKIVIPQLNQLPLQQGPPKPPGTPQFKPITQGGPPQFKPITQGGPPQFKPITQGGPPKPPELYKRNKKRI